VTAVTARPSARCLHKVLDLLYVGFPRMQPILAKCPSLLLPGVDSGGGGTIFVIFVAPVRKGGIAPAPAGPTEQRHLQQPILWITAMW